MAFFNRFPYTNFHELNLDWILNKINEISGLSLVKTVNNKSADADGNIALGVDDIPGAGTVKTINNIDPDSSGNVTIDSRNVPGTVRSVNWFAPDASTGNVNLSPINIGAVATVNSTAPDPTTGNVNVGTVKSVNNTQPDAYGNVNLPSVSGVTSVNNIGADGSGNVQLDAVDVNAVASVNGIFPDNTGDVELTARLVNALPDTFFDNLSYKTDGIDQSISTIDSGGYIEIGNLVIVCMRIKTISQVTANNPVLTGMPRPVTSLSTGSTVVSMANSQQFNISMTGLGRMILGTGSDPIPANTVIIFSSVYLKTT